MSKKWDADETRAQALEGRDEMDRLDVLDADGCPSCGDQRPMLLGRLGSVRWMRCRACGMDFRGED